MAKFHSVTSGSTMSPHLIFGGVSITAVTQIPGSAGFSQIQSHMLVNFNVTFQTYLENYMVPKCSYTHANGEPKHARGLDMALLCMNVIYNSLSPVGV